MKNKLFLLLLGTTLFLSGCFDPEVEKSRIKESVVPFYESLLFEDIDKTMNYFDTNSKDYFTYYQYFLESFNTQDLLYVAEGVSFESVTKESIKANVKLSITGVGPEKEHIEKKAVHQLVFRMNAEGLWKINTFDEMVIE